LKKKGKKRNATCGATCTPNAEKKKKKEKKKEGPSGPSLKHCALWKEKADWPFLFFFSRRGNASSYFSLKDFYRKSLIYEDPMFRSSI
jgi:hypothetical protein